MNWARETLLDLDRRERTRVTWADIAKAISIILLVIWTTVGDSVYINELLILVRMPLFFFVSGLFAYRAVVEADLIPFLRDRVSNLVYLFVLWTWLLFITTRMVSHYLWGTPMAPWKQLEIFWNVPMTIWFLYALGIAFFVARLVRGLPIVLVSAVLFAAYCVAVWIGDWRDMGFLDRFVRLFPFFWVGLVARPLVAMMVERMYRFWPLVGAAFLGLAWLVFDSPASALGPITFALTLIGILWLLTLSRALSEQGWARPLAIVGASTLYIYVMQRILLFYLDHGFDMVGGNVPGQGLISAAIIVVVGTVLGRWMAGIPWLHWLFEAPWVGGRMNGIPSKPAQA